MSEAMFKIAMGILCIDLPVALIFYVRTPPAFLPRMPTTVGSQLVFFLASRVLDGVRNAAGVVEDWEPRGYRHGYRR